MTAPNNDPWMMAAALMFGVVAVAPFSIMPLAVGGLIADFDLTVRQSGYIAAAEMGGSGLASLGVSAFITRMDRRRIAGAALVLFALVNIGAALTGNVWSLGLLRFIAGLCSGAVVATVSAILAGTRSPERSFSLFVLGNLVFGVIAFAAAPPLIMAEWGISGLYFLFAGLAVAALTGLRRLPGAPPAAAHANHAPPPPLNATAALALSGVLAAFIAFGGLWPFLEQIGAARGLSATQTGFALSGAQMGGVCTALLAGFLATRFERRKLLAASLIATMLGVSIFILNDSQPGYIVAVIAFNSAFIFVIPYLSGMLAALDPTGRLIVLGVTMQTAGLAIGPAGAGAVIAGSGYAALFIIAALFLGLALALMLSVPHKSRTAPE